MSAARRTTSVRFILIILLLYAAVVGVGIAYHEPWRDEADGWLAARDLSLTGIFRFAAYVGSPSLWLLILSVPAKLGAPYAAMSWTNAALALAAAAVFLRYAPFPRGMKVLALFSYYLAYEYAVLARTYALLSLVLFATAALYRYRWRRPVALAGGVFLLFNTSAHGAFFATIVTGSVALEFLVVWWRRRQARPGRRSVRAAHAIAVLVMFAGAISAAAQLWPRPDSQRRGAFTLQRADSIVESLTRSVAVPVGSGVFDPLFLLLNLAVLAVAYAYLARRPRALMVLTLGLLSLFYIFAFKWCVPERHAGLILLWFLFTCWIANFEPPTDALVRRLGGLGQRLSRVRRAVVLRMTAIALVPACFATGVALHREVRVEYSHGEQMARYMIAHGYDLRPLAVSHLAESVLPYLRSRTAWNLHNRAYGSHQTWDDTFDQSFWLVAGQIWERLERDYPGPERPMLLLEWDIAGREAAGYRLVHRTTGPVGPSNNERYFLYEPVEKPSP